MTTQQNKRPKVAVIIPHWNGIEVLEPCLRSLEASEYDQLEIVVVDNASSDESVAFVKREFPRVKVLQNSENLLHITALNKTFYYIDPHIHIGDLPR